VVEALERVESLALRAALGLIQVQDALGSSRAIQEPRRAFLGCETIEFALVCIRSFGLWKCSALGECSARVMLISVGLYCQAAPPVVVHNAGSKHPLDGDLSPLIYTESISSS
jgi:hypothetical protein